MECYDDGTKLRINANTRRRSPTFSGDHWRDVGKSMLIWYTNENDHDATDDNYFYHRPRRCGMIDAHLAYERQTPTCRMPDIADAIKMMTIGYTRHLQEGR